MSKANQSLFFINKQTITKLFAIHFMNKRKRSKDSSKKKEETPLANKQNTIKFNLSYDNLKCFMDDDRHPKTDRKRITNRYDSNLTDQKKYKEDQLSNEGVQVQHKIKRQLSPDPSRQASNSIIKQIQKKGVKCAWNEIQETKTEYSQDEEWGETAFLNQTFSERSNSYGKNRSHASTVDRFSGYGYYTQQLRNYSQQQQVLMNPSSDYLTQTVLSNYENIVTEKIKYYDMNVFEIDPLNIGHDPRTTLMIKNIPNKYTIQDLSQQIDHSFSNTYDFLYLPCDIKNNCNVGYGFINFIDTEVLFQFYKKFHHKRWIKFRSDKICVLTYARLQGLSSLIEHFQNSKVLNHKDKRYQPIIKDIRDCKKIQTLIKQQKSQQLSNKM